MKHTQLTAERYGGGTLYASLASDYSQRERPFTVTVAGPERYDGGRPTTYVLDACSTETRAVTSGGSTLSRYSWG